MEARTFVAAVALLATTGLLHSSLVAAAGTAHIVGGSTGWTIPPNTSFYSDWSSGQTIAAGDTLVFNFPTGFHTVVEVPKLNFDSCSTTKQIGSTFKNGPATVTVISGTHYYICSIPQHCSAGMKMAITVAAAAVAPSVSTAPPTVSRAAPAPAPKASVPTPSSPTSATAPAKGATGTANSPAPVAAHKVAGPTSSSTAPAPTPVSHSHARTAGPTASSPAPTTDKKPAPSPIGSVPSVPSSTANPPAATGPSDSGNGSNSSSALRGAAALVVGLLTVATVSFLL